MIQVTNLNKRFKKNHVLRDLNLELNQPGITALLGPNGSGKTTLVKSILGLVITDTGQILYDSKETKGQFL